MTFPFSRRSRERRELETHNQWLGQLRAGPFDGATVPLAELRPAPRYQPSPAALPAPVPAARDTAPMQRLPRMERVQARPRPHRPADAALFLWSRLLSQHIMLCGTCPAARRNRFADPTSAHMPFAFEALRAAAHAAGWRLDRYARWSCKACQDTTAYHAPALPAIRAAEAPTRAEPHLWDSWARGDEETKRLLTARAEQAALEGVNGSAQRGKHHRAAS